MTGDCELIDDNNLKINKPAIVVFYIMKTFWKVYLTVT